MRSVHSAQGYSCQLGNLGLGLPVFAQQYHLYPLPHDGILLALKRLLQALYLVMVALDHLAPPESDGL
jgi:hypothetical protein